ncbi:MAG: tetratricopeptide repeat protein [Nitrospirota bacterium]
MRYFMKIFLACVLVIFLSAGLSHAEKVTFVKEYTYQASELDSKHSSRTISLEMVKRLLLEEFGTYLISETEVKNMQLTKDQVTTYSAGIVSAEVIEEKWDGKTYWLKAKVSADPIEAQKTLKKIIDDKYKAKELEESRKKAEELVKENERLRKELEALAKAKKRDVKIEAKKIEDYERTIKKLDSIEWYRKGNYFLDKSYLDESQYFKAIEAFTKAIELDDKNYFALANRAWTYNQMGNDKMVIADVTKIIELIGRSDSLYIIRSLAKYYEQRGDKYMDLAEYRLAIVDFTKAIQVDTDWQKNCKNGEFEEELKTRFPFHPATVKFLRSINCDFANSGIGIAFNKRGMAYLYLGNYSQAVLDFNEALKLLGPNREVLINRGKAYKKLGKRQMAIKDYKDAGKLPVPVPLPNNRPYY